MTVEELNEIYTQNLRTLRKNKKLSQALLSEKINKTEKFYNDIETGRKWGSFDTLVALAAALNVEPYELFLPSSTVISHDEKKTKELMNRLRKNLNELLDTIEDFLQE